MRKRKGTRLPRQPRPLANGPQESAELKTRVVLELITGEKGLADASREYGIPEEVLSGWKKEFLELVPRIEELEGMVGQLTMQLDQVRRETKL